jgi:hypothetical protein
VYSVLPWPLAETRTLYKVVVGKFYLKNSVSRSKYERIILFYVTSAHLILLFFM